MTASANAVPRDRLRIAIQKSGLLAEPARALLASCGLSWRESRDRLFCYGETLPIDLLLVRDDDIPGLIADDVCDLGVVGRDSCFPAAPGDFLAEAGAISPQPLFSKEGSCFVAWRYVRQRRGFAGRHGLA